MVQTLWPLGFRHFHERCKHDRYSPPGLTPGVAAGRRTRRILQVTESGKQAMMAADQRTDGAEGCRVKAVGRLVENLLAQGDGARKAMWCVHVRLLERAVRETSPPKPDTHLRIIHLQLESRRDFADVVQPGKEGDPAASGDLAHPQAIGDPTARGGSKDVLPERLRHRRHID